MEQSHGCVWKEVVKVTSKGPLCILPIEDIVTK